MRECGRAGVGPAAGGGPTCVRPHPFPPSCRLMFFEQAREQAEREFKANNQDAMVSTAAAAAWAGSRPAALVQHWCCKSATALCRACKLAEMVVTGVHQACALHRPFTAALCLSLPLLPRATSMLACPPGPPQALTKWGGALLELAHFRQGNEAYDMIEEAIAKFEQVSSRGGWQDESVGVDGCHSRL